MTHPMHPFWLFLTMICFKLPLQQNGKNCLSRIQTLWNSKHEISYRLMNEDYLYAVKTHDYNVHK